MHIVGANCHFVRNTSHHGRAQILGGQPLGALQLQENDFLVQENRMLENYLRRVYPNLQLDLASSSDSKKKSKGKKMRSESKQEELVPLGAEEKANICSHEIDAVLSEVARVAEEGEQELTEVCRTPRPVVNIENYCCDVL